MTASFSTAINILAFIITKNQFARGKNQVNGIESFWSFTKLRLAKLHGIRPICFPLHLKESEWRFNHRQDNLYLLILKNLRLYSPRVLGKPQRNYEILPN